MTDEYYYYAISLELDCPEKNQSKDGYIHNFFEEKNRIFLEYKTKHIETTHDEPNKNQLCYSFEIINIIYQDEYQKDKIGDIVYGFEDFKYNINDKLSYSPQCFINDGGNLNCSGCYKSLVISWDEYQKYIDNDAKFYNCNIDIFNIFHDQNIIDFAKSGHINILCNLFRKKLEKKLKEIVIIKSGNEYKTYGDLDYFQHRKEKDFKSDKYYKIISIKDLAGIFGNIKLVKEIEEIEEIE